MSTNKNYDKILTSVLALNSDENKAKKVASVLDSKETLSLAVSGKIASGKDTVASKVIEKLNLDSQHFAFARPLKNEIDMILNALREDGKKSKPESFVKLMNISDSLAEKSHALTKACLDEDTDVTSYTRLKSIRTLTVFWANDVRRSVDNLYWVRACANEMFESIIENHHVHLTDLRYKDEKEVLSNLGFITARIDISEKTQKERLMSRDGLEPDPNVLASIAEVDLDECTDFSLRINNDGALETTVNKLTNYCKSASYFI